MIRLIFRWQRERMNLQMGKELNLNVWVTSFGLLAKVVEVNLAYDLVTCIRYCDNYCKNALKIITIFIRGLFYMQGGAIKVRPSCQFLNNKFLCIFFLKNKYKVG